MATILGKIRTIVLSNIHGLLDKAIDLNSIEAVRQYIRDLEHANEELAEAAAQADGYHRSLIREQRDTKAVAAELDRNIDFLLEDADPSNDSSAEAFQARLIGYQQRLTQLDEEIPQAKEVMDKLDQALANLTAKHRTMVQQIGQLEAMERAAKAKEGAAESLERLGELATAGAETSIDSVGAGIQRRFDVADARFDRAMGSMAGTVDKDLVKAQATAAIQERKRKIASQSSATAPAAETPTAES